MTTPVANYSGIGVTGFHHNIDPGREGMILNVNTVNQTESVNLEVDAGGNVIRTWNLAEIISAAMIAGGDDPSQFVYPAPPIGFTTTPAPTAALKVKEANPRSREVMEKGTGNFGGVRREIGEINFRRIVVGRHSRLTFIDRTGKPQKTSAI